MNSIFKYKARVLPSLLEYNEKFNELPQKKLFTFACIVRFYKGK